MHIIHSFNGKRIDEHTRSDAAFLITNKKGNYLSLGQKNFSHTQGLLFFEHERWELYKTIEDIKLDKEMTSIKNGLSSVERLYKDDTVESFNLFNNSLVYSVHNYTGELVLELDFREIFNYDDKGRIYSITKEDDIIIIRYDKFTDHSLSVIDKTRFLAIKGAGSRQARTSAR